MDLRLEVLRYQYYNTLGFYLELMACVDHIDDSIVSDMMNPRCRNGIRLPIDPWVCYRMHCLNPSRPEISSFRVLKGPCHRGASDKKRLTLKPFMYIIVLASNDSHLKL